MYYFLGKTVVVFFTLHNENASLQQQILGKMW